jgi:hypothetical protein
VNSRGHTGSSASCYSTNLLPFNTKTYHILAGRERQGNTSYDNQTTVQWLQLQTRFLTAGRTMTGEGKGGSCGRRQVSMSQRLGGQSSPKLLQVPGAEAGHAGGSRLYKSHTASGPKGDRQGWHGRTGYPQGALGAP